MCRYSGLKTHKPKRLAGDRENGASTFKYWTSTSWPTPPATNVGLPKSLNA
jgi:hypothetical protein